MFVVFKYLLYSVAIVGLVSGCLFIFKNHPEVQFAFLMPGLFILTYSVIRDDIYKRNNITFIRAGFRER